VLSFDDCKKETQDVHKKYERENETLNLELQVS